MAVWLSETLPQLQDIRPRVTIHKPCNRIRNEEIKIQVKEFFATNSDFRIFVTHSRNHRYF